MRTVAEIQADFNKSFKEFNEGIAALEAMVSDMDIRGTFRASLANQDESNR